LTLENQVLAVSDYDKFKQVVNDLLQELQSIKANRNEAALKTLFESTLPSTPLANLGPKL